MSLDVDWSEIAKRNGWDISSRLLRRPWWTARGAVVWAGRVSASCFERTDGKVAASEEAAERIDSEKPLPAPEPACLQVWRDAYGESTVLEVWPAYEKPAFRQVLFSRSLFSGGIDNRSGPPWVSWPPLGGVLIAGPGSPWAPAEEGQK